MKSYFKLEFYRTIKLNKGLLATLLLSIFMIFLLNFDLSAKEQKFIDTKIKYTKEMGKNNRKISNSSHDDSLTADENKEIYGFSTLSEVLKQDQQHTDNELSIYQAFKKKNWSPYLRRENTDIKQIEFTNAELKKLTLFSNSHSEFIQIKLELNNILIKKSLPYESARYGTSNYLFLYSLLSYLCSPLGIAIYLLFFGSIHFKIFSGDQIKSIVTMPISRASILISNTIIFLFRTIGITLFICLIGFLIASVFGGKVPYDYPIVTFSQGLQFMPIVYYLIKTLYLFFFVLIFSFVFCQLIVLLTKTDFMAVFLTILIISAFSFIFQTKELSSQPISAFLPFTYTTPSRVLSGQSQEDIVYLNNSDTKGYEKRIIIENQEYYVGDSLSKRNPYINDQLGLIVISIWTLLLLSISILLIKKRRI